MNTQDSPDEPQLFLDAWSVWHDPAMSADPYRAPETRRISLAGSVRGHATFPDGERIVTSPIASACGRRITTRSGTVYHLGEPSPDYRSWVTETLGRPWNDDEPIRVIVSAPPTAS